MTTQKIERFKVVPQPGMRNRWKLVHALEGHSYSSFHTLKEAIKVKADCEKKYGKYLPQPVENKVG